MGKDRLIVALDVDTHQQAFDLVHQLDNVSFFKVGLQLFMAGDVLGLIKTLQESRNVEGGVFIDLKLAGDIGNTIKHFVAACMTVNVKFITFVEAVPTALTLSTLRAARDVRGSSHYPRLLMVPLLSSMDADDLGGTDPTEHIVARGRDTLAYGCDGLIVSGDAIAACRATFPDVEIVSPGIRPLGWPSDDQRRHTTPRDAILLGSDYLVVGRPITGHDSPRDAAEGIIAEIDEALALRDRQFTAAGS